MATVEGPIWVTLIKRTGGPMLFQYPITVASNRRYPDLYGLDIKYMNYAYRFPDGAVMADARELGAAAGLIKEKLEAGIWDIFTEPVYKQAEKVLTVAEQISALDLDSLDNAVLIDWFQKYTEELEIYNPVYSCAPTVTLILGEMISAPLREILAKRGEAERLEHYLEALIYPLKRSPIEQATRELMRLAANIQISLDLRTVFQSSPDEILATLPKGHPEFFSQVEEFAQHYAFINMDFGLGELLSVREVLTSLKTVVNEKDANQTLAGMHEHEQEREGLAQKIIEDFGIPGELLELIKFARNQFTLKQYMRSVSLRAMVAVRDFLTEIGKRVGFTHKELQCFTPPEVIEALKGKAPEPAKIRQRLEDGYGLYLVNGEFKVIVGEELAKEVAAAIGEVPKRDVLEGAVAYPGKHEGPIKIVLVREEIDKMKRGDVLVAPMTDPYLVPAMIKAGAIVTDEGGLLSHAAIVSREQGIPCIVGTEQATTVLQDGDFVEVDAEGTRGIVRILKTRAADN